MKTGAVIALVIALCAVPSMADAPPMSVKHVPLIYRALFERGREFRYAVKQIATDDEVDRVNFVGKSICSVMEVSESRSMVRSRIKCVATPPEPTENRQGVSTKDLVDGDWIATRAGLWRVSSDASEPTLEPDKMLIPSRPKAFRTESSSEESGQARGLKRDRGAWCSFQVEWSGDQGGVERCFSPHGIVRAHQQEAGGFFFEASLELERGGRRAN